MREFYFFDNPEDQPVEKGKVYYFDLLSFPNWWLNCLYDKYLKEYYIERFGEDNWPMTAWHILLPVECNDKYDEITNFDTPVVVDNGVLEVEVPINRDWGVYETDAISDGENSYFIQRLLEVFLKEYSRRYYKNFLKSEYWKKLRKQCFERDGFRCVKCGSAKNLNAHHLNYDNIGKPEELDDLVTLCGECHTKIHQTDIERKAYEEKSSNNDL